MKIGVVVTCLVTLCALVVGSNQSKADFCPLGVDAGIYACSVRLPSQNGAPALLVFESGVLVDRNTNASQINSSVCRQSNSMTEALDIHQIPPIQHMGFTPQFHWLDTHVPNAGADYELYMTRTKAQMTIKNCIIRQIPLCKNASRLVGSTYQTDSDNGDTPIATTCAARHATDCVSSPKWKRIAVEASRSRST